MTRAAVSEKRVARVIRDLENASSHEAKWGMPSSVFHDAVRVIKALAAATGTAKTAKRVECEASQSGGDTPKPGPPKQHHQPTIRNPNPWTFATTVEPLVLAYPLSFSSVF